MRTICDVLRTLRERAEGDAETIELIELAQVMALKMQDKLKEYAGRKGAVTLTIDREWVTAADYRTERKRRRAGK